MRVRRLNDIGLARFRTYLAELRETPTKTPPVAMLEDDTVTLAVPEGVEVDHRPLRTKSEAATYLKAQLGPLSRQDLFKDAGLWTWLSLFYFDQVCPAVAGGQRKPANDAHYLLEPNDSFRYYKHLLATPVRVLGLAPVHHKVLLNAPLPVLGQIMERMAARLYLLRIPCVPEVIDLLYYDETKGRAKRGIANPNRGIKRGDLTNRFPARMRQLQLTYDAHALSAGQLVKLLGREFEPWLPKPTLPFE